MDRQRMSSGHSADESSRTCIITLVHGTWGRGFFPRDYETQSRSWWSELFPAAPPWFCEGSDFRNNLESELRKEDIAATFRMFRWSGANSVFHRASAGADLGSLLASDSDDTNSIVIAHSHGGNLALRAISRLGSRGARIHLITLATPFLRVFPTWSGPGFLEVTFYVYILTLYAIFLLVGALLNGVSPILPGYGEWVVVVFMASLLLISGVTAALVVRLIINPARPSDRIQFDRQRWSWRPFIIADEANYDSAGPHAPNLLVIRGVDDEAALLLAFGAIAIRVNRFALGAMWNWLYPVGFLLFTGYWLAWYTLGIDRQLLNQISFYVGQTIFVGTAIFLLLPALFNSRFGREFLIGAFRCEIATDSAPDLTRARIITLETPYQQLPFRGWGLRRTSNASSTSSMRHKIYSYPRCVPEIVKWIKEQVR